MYYLSLMVPVRYQPENVQAVCPAMLHGNACIHLIAGHVIYRRKKNNKHVLGYTYKIFNSDYNTEMSNKH